MIVITCDQCHEVIMKMTTHRYCTSDWMDYLRKPETHMCNTCWIKQRKIEHKLKKELQDK